MDEHNAQPNNGLRILGPSVSHCILADTCKNDPALAAIVNAWPKVPEALKAGILAMVRAAN
jgi:hypothetical protein